jgi:hypothetical protein
MMAVRQGSRGCCSYTLLCRVASLVAFVEGEQPGTTNPALPPQPLAAAGAVSQGCHMGLLPHLQALIAMLLPRLADPEPMVRALRGPPGGAACCAAHCRRGDPCTGEPAAPRLEGVLARAGPEHTPSAHLRLP